MKNHSVLVNNHFSSSQERPSPRSEQMKVNIEPLFLHEAQNCLYLKDKFCRIPKCWDYVECQPHIHIRLIPVFIEYNVLQCGEN